MKITIGKTFQKELKVRDNGELAAKDERATVIANVLSRGTSTKNGIMVDVTADEIQHLIDECEWFIYMNTPEDSGDDRKEYNNLRRQLKTWHTLKGPR